MTDAVQLPPGPRRIETCQAVSPEALGRVVELIDREGPIRRFLPLLDEMLPHGVVALSPVHIITYSGGVEG